ncbi:AurF N-oxygenase family protein [Nocardioides terrisoli]|uniref:AurF N-oxygenase family protein n=1 Tax=Nocardioides terrisoli TaxID=3388267 RepID=UPI00287BAA96|nr:diiron oxygenase [Nocardioides marmorisolisilvae]
MTAIETERLTADKLTYDEKLRTLSEGSVHQHFDPWTDIDWDAAGFVVDASDPRWVLPETDALGRHPWYRALPLERQIEVGLWRQANVAKVGLQFENVLIRGLMEHVMTLPNGSAEFRYCTHEATEETHHTQMFQEFVNRTGADVPGGPAYFRALATFLPLAARYLPSVFFIGVLAGEEPIDHVQKAILRAGDEMHPLLQRIMQIHVAEEARHISFAHEYLKRRVPRQGRLQRAALSVVFPVVMRVLCDVIMVPGKEMTRDVGVPKDVLDEVFWDSPDGHRLLRELFSDVRMLAEELDLMNPVSRRVWRLLRIDGRPARYRSEPAAA